MDLVWEDALKLGASLVLGSLLGAERELHDRAAGLRTIILVCLGSTLFAIYAPALGGDGDPARITAAVVSGVGFLGAGVIIREAGGVTGITTAATIWLSAAIGVGVGGGLYALAVIATGLALVVLSFFFHIETRIDRARELRIYSVVVPPRHGKLSELERTFVECGLDVRSHRQAKEGDRLSCTWSAAGSLAAHQRLVEALFEDAEVSEFRY